jgi:aminocarboxymuconate-semialdehyde decarboxylase
MIIDIATHVYPKQVFDRVKRIAPGFGSMGTRIDNTRQLYDFDDRFRLMDEAGEYAQIISLSNPPIEEFMTSEQGAEIARLANDSMAELVSRHKDRFPGFVASVSLRDTDAAMTELHRAIGELGACGVQIFTDVAGRPMDDPEFDPLFAAMNGYGLPIWLHPTRTPGMPDFASESTSQFDLWLVLGWPYATAATMIRLVLAGLFERHVGLRIITHHMGGMIPFHVERVAGALHRLGLQAARKEQGSGGPYMRRPPMEMMRMFYADTAMHGAVDATRCGLAFFGANNTVFATDCPFGSIRKGLDMIERLELDEPVKQKILHANARRLLGTARFER